MTLASLRRIALAFEGAVEQPHHEMTSFRAAGRIFATVTPDGASLHVFVDAEERDRALAVHTAHCEALSWGASIVGLRMPLATTPAKVIRELLHAAFDNALHRPRRRAR